MEQGDNGRSKLNKIYVCFVKMQIVNEILENKRHWKKLYDPIVLEIYTQNKVVIWDLTTFVTVTDQISNDQYLDSYIK